MIGRRMIGRKIVIGSTHARASGYGAFVGSKGVVVNYEQGLWLVRLTEVRNKFLDNYLNETIYVNPEDMIDDIQADLEAADILAMKVGDVIHIKGDYAEKMGYMDAVGHEAVIQYKAESYVEAFILSGEAVGQMRDIHIEDCHVPPAEEEKGSLYVLVDHAHEEIHYSDTLSHLKIVSEHKMGRIEALKKRADFTHLIGTYGYLAKPAFQATKQVE